MNYKLVVIDSTKNVVRECFFTTHVEARVARAKFGYVYPESDGYEMVVDEVGT